MARNAGKALNLPRLASSRPLLQPSGPSALRSLYITPSWASKHTRTFATTSFKSEESRKVTSDSPPFDRKAGHGGVTSTTSENVDPMTGERLVPAGSEDIDVSKLVIEKTNAPKSKAEASELVFGKTFTDHMLAVPWSAQSGWGTPKISPYQPISLDPSATVFHYAPCLFEGMKAYKNEAGEVRLFRPDMNMKRMRQSAARLGFPDFSEAPMVELLRKYVQLDSDWIPSLPGYSLYIRPTMIGTTASLGVAASTEVLLYVIACPVGPYYATGFKPVSLLASTATGDVRAWPGGTGGYKLGANYAAGVVPQQKAAAQGYQQILWLYGDDDELTEVGTMNLFVVFEQSDGSLELVTPPLNDMILPGITRDSILALARGHESSKAPVDGLPKNIKVSERRVVMQELVDAAACGKLKEAFGAGTAAVVSSVKSIGYKNKELQIPVGQGGLGPFAEVMNREIMGRQMGVIPSKWTVSV